MTLQIYNTLTRTKERFEPVDPNHVRMYVCGPTVYDFAHIGNARPVIIFDVLYRLLKRLYPRVTYVRNITDVDDKIIARSKETGEDIAAITARYADQYHADMEALGALPPDVEPRATAHIAQMIAMIEKLIASGHAYPADGHVLFSVPSMADYGRLSRHSRDELIAGARVDVAPYKKDPADFVLWKPSTPDQPGWDSPWGRGRPGWHLECSAMSETHLGQTFDIHGGGLDLIFPHHENEIAQSQCAHGGAPFVKYWMHNGYVTVEGEKMSKSLGNFYTVRQLLDDGWNGETIRYVLLSAHYRSPLDFSKEALRTAKSSLDRMYLALRNAERIRIPQEWDSVFMDRLCDDLNTPGALARLHEITSELNRAKSAREKGELAGLLVHTGQFIGLLQHDFNVFLKTIVGTIPTPEENPTLYKVFSLSDEQIENLIQQRTEARKAKNFGRADELREELASKGIILEDRPDGTTDWRRA